MTVSAANKNWLPAFLGRVGSIRLHNQDQGQDDDQNDGEDEDQRSERKRSDAPLNALLFGTACSTLYILFGNFRALVTFNGLGEYTFFFLTMIGAVILRIREPNLRRPYKPFIAIPVLFAIVSGFVVARGAVFAPFQAAVLLGVWGVGLVFYWGRRWYLRVDSLNE